MARSIDLGLLKDLGGRLAGTLAGADVRTGAQVPVAAFWMAERKGMDEWFGSGAHLAWLDRAPASEGLAAAPHHPTPGDPEQGRRLLAGVFVLAGGEMVLRPEADPWDRPSPSRAFAVALHRFDWLPDLLTMGEAGASRALALVLGWKRLFGRWGDFSWESDILERRVVRLACFAKTILAKASEDERAQILNSLYRQARHLAVLRRDPGRAADRAAAAALAGCALLGAPGDKLRTAALRRLDKLLPQAVPEGGGHASRSPQRAVQLLADLTALSDGLSQRRLQPSPVVTGALKRLKQGAQFLTLADGRLAAFHGGESARSPLADEFKTDDQSAIIQTQNGYHRLRGIRLEVVVDAAEPPQGAFSTAGCGQPLAIEVTAGVERLITNTGWSLDADAPHALRLSEGGSALALGDLPAGEPVHGVLAAGFGTRLYKGASHVQAMRQQAGSASWLEASHDAWRGRHGLTCHRRLYVDRLSDDLRGEDSLRPQIEDEVTPHGRRYLPFSIRFHLFPGVKAQLSKDGKSVLIRGALEPAGWRLRSDAAEMSIDVSTVYLAGVARRSSQVVLRGQCKLGKGAKVRWKLSRAGD